jgi:hypothetical protein
MFGDFANALGAVFAQLGFTNPLPMWLGDGEGAVVVPTSVSEEPGSALAYVHAKTGLDNSSNARRAVSQALNPYGYSEHGLPVIVAEHMATHKRTIIAMDADKYVSYSASMGWQNSPLRAHRDSHYLWGAGCGAGADPVFIESIQVVNLKIQPLAGLYVQLVGTSNRSVYLNSAGEPVVQAGATAINLTAHVPANPGKAVWVCISLNVDTAIITVTDGAEFDPTAGNGGIPPIILDVDATHMPAVPAGDAGKAYVYLEEGQVTIDYQHIRQVEPQPAIAGAAGIDDSARFLAWRGSI